MTRTQYYTATSIDGFIADSDNSLEWLFPLRQSERGTQEYPTFVAEIGALAMGSTTYRWILDDIILKLGSVFLGAGAPLLPRRITPPRLRLVEVAPDGPDFVTVRYELARAAET